jgi:hypothetical protein
MSYDFNSSEEEAFDRLVKRLLAEEWERFPAPGPRVWRALAARLGSQAKVSMEAPCVPVITGRAGELPDQPGLLNEVGTAPGVSGPSDPEGT